MLPSVVDSATYFDGQMAKIVGNKKPYHGKLEEIFFLPQKKYKF